MLGGAKRVLGCSSKTYTEAVWGDMGLEVLQGKHDKLKRICNLCGEDCESVDRFLWNCPAYSERCALFLEHLKKTLGKEFERFKSCDTAGNHVSFWGQRFEGVVLRCWSIYLNPTCIIDIWAVCKSKLYDSGWHWSAAVSKPTREVQCLPGQG